MILFNLIFFYSLTDQIEMALFVLRYVSNLSIFALGLRAPGIATDSDYHTLIDSSTTQSRYYQRVSNYLFCITYIIEKVLIPTVIFVEIR